MTSEGAYSVEVVGNVAYLAALGSGLLIVDVTNSMNPVLIGSYDALGAACSVSVVGSTAYVAFHSSLHIIDISSPHNPVLLGSVTPHATSLIFTCMVHNDKLFVSDANWNEISVYDISVPQTPVLSSIYAWNLVTRAMCFSNNTLFTANGLYGLQIHTMSGVVIDDDAVGGAELIDSSNYPNPFNPSTTLFFEIRSQYHGQAHVYIYNTRGQLVRNMSMQVNGPGYYCLCWDGSDVHGKTQASGLYHYTCKVGKILFEGKMTMLK